jgi:hypothetical protein
VAELPNDPKAIDVTIDATHLRIQLDNGRTVSVHIADTTWLRWLRDASVEEQSHWAIEPGGYAVYWPNLDDGVEIAQLLERQSIDDLHRPQTN